MAVLGASNEPGSKLLSLRLSSPSPRTLDNPSRISYEEF